MPNLRRRLQTLPFGSGALLDAVEEALDSEMDDSELAEILAERHWRYLAGEPAQFKAEWPPTTFGASRGSICNQERRPIDLTKIGRRSTLRILRNDKRRGRLGHSVDMDVEAAVS